MEKDRNARIIAIVALVLAVAGVSIGFAVLSTNLTIEAPEASVKANNDLFTVYFSNKDSEYSTGEVTPTLSESDDPEFTGNTITIEDKSTTLSGIGGTFTEPGQIITYNLGIANISKLDGYVFYFSGVEGNCEAVNSNNPATQEELERACNDLIFRIDIDDGKYTATKYKKYANYLISKMTDGKPGMHKLKLEIEYKADAIPVTGDFKVTFSNAEFNYRTEVTPY